MAVVLIIQTGKHKGRKILFPPDGTLLIGRDAECHLRLASTDVSRRHCELSNTENGVVVKDLGSRNGTFIDGFLISETAALNPGSILKVGNIEFALPGKRPEPSGQKPKSVDDTSDDDIAAWLTDEGETEDPSDEESTIIRGSVAEIAAEEEQVNQKDYTRHPQAQEAADIIRNHWQAKEQH
jgi:pSer/pThr/pTyr-binding forkhead associated (FHA) protein